MNQPHRGPIGELCDPGARIEHASLSVVIPVWNEATAIEPVLQTVEAAKRAILRAEPRIREVEVLVTDDGSTDGTREIVEAFPGIIPVHMGRHAGYGAALKRGFREASGDLLGFMDGDYTCELGAFAALSRRVLAGQSDIVNGNRLHAASRMPRHRYLGNALFSSFLSLLSGRRVGDCCSGMRVFRRALLPIVDELPDDLSFSPALTATVLSSPTLRLDEEIISYNARLGSSKLFAPRDAWRFLWQILSCYYAPSVRPS